MTQRPALPLPEIAVHWRGGEGAIGRPRAIERATSQLGPRLGWLLQGIAALHGGSRAEVARIAAGAREAGMPQLAAVLDLLLADPGTIDPTAVRKAAKKQGLEPTPSQRPGEAPFPILDLLRSLAVYRTGSESPPAAPLREAGRHGAPALHLAIEALTTRSDRVGRLVVLEAYLPRANQVLAAARVLRVKGHIPEGVLAANFDQDLLGLTRAQWPDLYGGDHRAALVRRLAGDEPWVSGHDDLAEWLYARPASERKAWLGPMVGAIATRVEQGRLHGLIGLVHAAAHLAASDPALRDLARQLVGIDSRIGWTEADAPELSSLLAAIWTSRPSLAPEARLALALRIVRAPLEDPDEDGLARTEAAFLVLAKSSELEAIRAALDALDEVDDEGTRQWTPAIRQAGADGTRVKLVQALVDARSERASRAVEAVPELVRAGEGEAAALVVIEARPGTTTGAAAAATALASIDGPSVMVLHALTRLAVVLPEVPEPVGAVAMRSLGGSVEIVGATVALLAAMGQADRAKDRMLEEGRTLRKLPAAAADERAMTLIAAALIGAGETPRTVRTVIDPLVRFLLREGPSRALVAARATGPTLRPGVVTFYLQFTSELDREPRWLDLIVAEVGPPMTDLPPEIVAQGRRFVQEALREGPATYEELQAAMEVELAHQLESIDPSRLAEMLDHLF